MSSSREKELGKIQRQAELAAGRAMKAGEHDVAKSFVEIAQKLEQKIQGHRSQRRKK